MMNGNDEWIKDMNEELDHIEKIGTWELVPRPKDKNVIRTDKNVIRTKWVYKNKFSQDGQVIRNKEILVCKGYVRV